jgi:predicted nucleic acid-binding protein
LSAFADTSALYALLDPRDQAHERAAERFPSLAADGLLTHNYVVVECGALVQARLGWEAAREFHESLVAALDVVWVSAEVHRAAVGALLAGVGRGVSLVDWTSFEVMRRRGLRRAFALDRDFVIQGFETVP